MEQYNVNNPVEPIKPQKSGAGAIVGAIIIIILLLLGAFYFWGARLNSLNSNPPPLILGNETADASASSDTSSGLPPQGTSDEVAQINADLRAMDLDKLGEQNNGTVQSVNASVQ